MSATRQPASSERGHRWLWYAAGGLAIGAAGFGWDAVWHSRQEGEQIGGAAELVQAHWLMFLGVLVIAGSLLMAVLRLRSPRPVAVATRAAFLGVLATVVGFVWDSIRHAQGTESDAGHALIYGGLTLVVVGLAAALLARRRLSV